MYKIEHVSYDPSRIVSFAPKLEDRMNAQAAEGWVLMGQPMVSEKLAFVILFWFKAEEEDAYDITIKAAEAEEEARRAVSKK